MRGTDDDSTVCEARAGAEIETMTDDDVCSSSDDSSAGGEDKHKEDKHKEGDTRTVPGAEEETGNGLGLWEALMMTAVLGLGLGTGELLRADWAWVRETQQAGWAWRWEILTADLVWA